MRRLALHTPYGGQEGVPIEMKYLLEVEIFWSLNLHSMRFGSVDSRCAYPATRHSRGTEVCTPIDIFSCSVLSIPVKRSREVCHMKTLIHTVVWLLVDSLSSFTVKVSVMGEGGSLLSGW